MDYRIILCIIIIGIIAVFLITDTSESIFMQSMEPFTTVDWDEVRERDIIKNSIPIELLNETNQGCITTAVNFDTIINNSDFISHVGVTNC